jgi:hypothetical protein
MIAGLLLVLSGGMLALGVSNDWLVASLPGGSDATLHLVGTRFGSALFAFAGALAILGLWRLGRGYSNDETVQRLATAVAFGGVLVALIRVFLFLSDHSLALTSRSTYLNDLSLQPGLYFVAGGLMLALLTRFG